MVSERRIKAECKKQGLDYKLVLENMGNYKECFRYINGKLYRFYSCICGKFYFSSKYSKEWKLEDFI